MLTQDFQAHRSCHQFGGPAYTWTGGHVGVYGFGPPEDGIMHRHDRQARDPERIFYPVSRGKALLLPREGTCGPVTARSALLQRKSYRVPVWSLNHSTERRQAADVTNGL